MVRHVDILIEIDIHKHAHTDIRKYTYTPVGVALICYFHFTFRPSNQVVTLAQSYSKEYMYNIWC